VKLGTEFSAQSLQEGSEKMKRLIIFSVGALLLCFALAGQAQETKSAESRVETAPAGPIADEYTIFKQLRNGVLTVRGDMHDGTGFLLDERGIVLTCRQVIQNTKRIRVQSARRIKVEAKLLAEDATNDIAAIWVNMEALRETVVLPLANPSARGVLMVEGEKVLAIGSPVHEKEIPMLATGIASSVQAEKILSDAKVSEFHDGGPMINMRGEVVGLLHPGGSVRAEKVETLLRAARQAMATASPPSAQLLPVEPETRFPAEALVTFVQRPDFQKFDVDLGEASAGRNLGWGGSYYSWVHSADLVGSGSNLYKFGAGKYNAIVFTPIMAWYLDERETIQSAREKEKRQKKTRGASEVVQQQWNWSKYEDKYPAVVLLAAIPEVTETRKSAILGGLTKGLTRQEIKYKASFSEMSLLCDGKEVPPIEPGKGQREIPRENAAKTGAVTFTGLYTYPFDVFDPNRCRQLELKIFSEDDAANPDVKIVPAKVVQRVWADFEGYRKTATTQ
jgi:trypsin-like peptidase